METILLPLLKNLACLHNVGGRFSNNRDLAGNDVLSGVVWWRRRRVPNSWRCGVADPFLVTPPTHPARSCCILSSRHCIRMHAGIHSYVHLSTAHPCGIEPRMPTCLPAHFLLAALTKVIGEGQQQESGRSSPAEPRNTKLTEP
jgi:hypothetical protein